MVVKVTKTAVVGAGGFGPTRRYVQGEYDEVDDSDLAALRAQGAVDAAKRGSASKSGDAESTKKPD